MFNGLRFRLIVSYIVIIAVCLAIMAMALALLVRSNPLGRELTQERLTLSLNSVTRLVQKDLRDGTAPEQVMTDLPVRFDTQQTHVLFFTGLNRRIIADSDDALGGRDLGEFALGLPVRLPDGTITGNINVGDTQPWIYVARPAASGPRNVGILVAQAPQSISLRSPIYTQMLRQLAFAGCIGGALSVLLALLIAGSVSSPLRRLTKAANTVA
jgi:hypothetical protein